MHNIEDHIAQLYGDDVEVIWKASAAVKQVDAFMLEPESIQIHVLMKQYIEP